MPLSHLRRAGCSTLLLGAAPCRLAPPPCLPPTATTHPSPSRPWPSLQRSTLWWLACCCRWPAWPPNPRGSPWCRSCCRWGGGQRGGGKNSGCQSSAGAHPHPVLDNFAAGLHACGRGADMPPPRLVSAACHLPRCPTCRPAAPVPSPQRRGIKLNPITTLYLIAPCCFAFLCVPFVRCTGGPAAWLRIAAPSRLETHALPACLGRCPLLLLQCSLPGPNLPPGVSVSLPPPPLSSSWNCPSC